MTDLRRDDPARTGRSRAKGRLAVGLLIALALLPIAVSTAFGAFDLVRNDDWAWAEILWRWEDTGELRLNGWPSMFLVGQLVLAWPIARVFPDNLAALELWTVALGVVAVLATYWTVRQLLSVGRAAAATALALLSPLYAPLAMSFMTDVPAFAAQAVSLALGVRALHERTTARLALYTSLSFAVGIIGFTIREYAIVAPAAVGLVLVARAVARRDRREIGAVVVPGFFFAVVALVVLSLRLGMSGSLTFKPSVAATVDGFGGDFGRSVLYVVVTLAFLVLPAFVFVPLRPLLDRVAAKRWRLVLALGFIVAAAVGLVGGWIWSPPLLSPYLDERGTFGTDVTPGIRATLLPEVVFRALLAAVLVASVLVVVVLVAATARTVGRSERRRAAIAELDVRALLVTFVIGSLLAVIFVGTTDLPVFDRYLLAVAPFAAALVLDTAPRRFMVTGSRRLVQWSALGAFGLLGLVWTTDSAAFDSARWEAAERAVDLGVPADRVDAGFEWRNTVRPPGQIPLAPSQPDPDVCVVMGVQTTGAPVPSDALVTVGWSNLLGRRGRIIGVTTGAPDCPALP